MMWLFVLSVSAVLLALAFFILAAAVHLIDKEEK